jgi:hypothetical protein
LFAHRVKRDRSWLKMAGRMLRLTDFGATDRF